MKGKDKPRKKTDPGNHRGIERWLSDFRFSLFLLILVTFVLYFRTISLDYTKLDDSIFIVENARFNSDAHNLATAFQRGLFNPTKDAYYRPVFLVDFIIESRFFGIRPAGYHFTNVLFHIISVVLLFLFLRKIKIPEVDSFLLALIFAVHPVLSQAVAWIPGRNDMLLMIFFLSCFILVIDYLEKPGSFKFIFQFFFLVLALFTKETAIIIPVIMGGVLWLYLKYSWKKILFPVISWITAIGLWLFIRSTATLSGEWFSLSVMLQAGLSRLIVVVQYLGKIFLPFNLTVFPVMDDITPVWGILAIVILAALIVHSKSYSKPLTYVGLFWFIAFLVPVLIVPKSLNDQVFEHRLYLPLTGILIMLSQVFPFTGDISSRNKMVITGALIIVFGIQSFVRIGYYNDAITFWNHAVEGSPHSAYARMLLGTKVEEASDRERLFKEAIRLDPDLKNLNYYLAKVLFDRKQSDSAEYYIRKELMHNPLADAYFLLALIQFSRDSFDSSAINLEKVIEINPVDPQANHNLVLLYYQHGQPDKARQVLQNMQLKGMEVGDDLMRMVYGK
jgi:protein O-mannosyl-transferase